MKEYKTVSLDFGQGFFTKKEPNINAALNENARDGWELKQILTPTKNFGETSKYILVFERDSDYYLKSRS
jgi:hypothetical protein